MSNIENCKICNREMGYFDKGKVCRVCRHSANNKRIITPLKAYYKRINDNDSIRQLEIAEKAMNKLLEQNEGYVTWGDSIINYPKFERTSRWFYLNNVTIDDEVKKIWNEFQFEIYNCKEDKYIKYECDEYYCSYCGDESSLIYGEHHFCAKCARNLNWGEVIGFYKEAYSNNKSFCDALDNITFVIGNTSRECNWREFESMINDRGYEVNKDIERTWNLVIDYLECKYKNIHYSFQLKRWGEPLSAGESIARGAKALFKGLFG